MSVTLHPVTLRDLEALAALHARCFPDDAWDATALAGVLAMRGASGRFVATPDRTMAGFLFDLIQGEEAEILTLGVHPDERRCGIARLLLEELGARATAAGAVKLLLEVAADNEAALALYRACGFRAVGRRPGYYRYGPGAPVDAWLLRRALP